MKWDEGMGWIDVAHNKDKWQAPVNAVFRLWVRKMWGNSSLAESRLASQEGLCFMELIS
jgi:hypothetical protein